MIYKITPIAKCRMTRSDRWRKRPCVMRYWKFKDEVKKLGIKVEDHDTIVFHIPMPKSWSTIKREEMDGAPHKQKPDIDNLLKALLDALFDDDSHISAIRVRKHWSTEGMIGIE